MVTFPVGHVSRRSRLSATALRWLFEDADAVSGFACVGIRATDGAAAVLMHEIQGYSFSEVTVEFAGLYRSFDDFRQSLVSDGWIMGVEEFSELPVEEQKRLLGLTP